MIEGERVTLQWKITTVDPVTLVWYLEFTDGDPNDSATDWFREVDEQDTGAGVVSMAAVLRTFNDNGGTAGLAAGGKFSCQFVRQAQFVHIVMRASVGGANVTITAPFGSLPVSG